MEPNNSILFNLSKSFSTAEQLISSQDMIPTRDTSARPSNQIWLLFMLECPLHTGKYFYLKIISQCFFLTGSVTQALASSVNWTATYRSDSTIVAPYEKWVYHDDNIKTKKQPINYAANKTKKVAWFVSNCAARNNRLEYARNLR